MQVDKQTCSYMPAKPSQRTLSRGGAYLATLQCSWPSAICSNPSRLRDPLHTQERDPNICSDLSFAQNFYCAEQHLQEYQDWASMPRGQSYAMHRARTNRAAHCLAPARMKPTYMLARTGRASPARGMQPAWWPPRCHPWPCGWLVILQ